MLTKYLTKKRLQYALLLIVTIALIGVIPVQAKGLQLSLEELREKSDRIVIATIINKSTRVEERYNTAWTDYVLSVNQMIKGDEEDDITISFAGAKNSAAYRSVLNLPELDTGSTYLLFLHPLTIKYASATVGWEQGVFKVHSVDNNKIFISLEGEPLIIDEKGSLQRGMPEKIVDRTFLYKLSSELMAALAVRAEEPLITNWKGEVIQQPRNKIYRSLSKKISLEFAKTQAITQFFGQEN